MEKVIKRGYVKWTDEDGIFHKEPLADHPELLSGASELEKLRAEEVRRLNGHAEENQEEREKTLNEEAKEALAALKAALKAAPDEVLTVSQLDDGEPVEEEIDEDLHRQALEELREKTKED